MIKLLHGYCLEQMQTLPDNSVDSIVTDPPYGINFMGKKWDYDVPSVEVWREAMRVLKPGGHALIACGTRTQHRMVVNIEDAGFEIRDVVSWIYGSGFPKSLNVSKAIDKCNGDPNRLEKFTAWMRTTGIKSREIDAITGTNMGGHYLTAKSQPAIPTAALWAKLRPHIIMEIPAWVDELIDRIEAEREVVGTQHRAAGNDVNVPISAACGNKNGGWFDITAPATDAAKQWDGWGTALKPACEFFTLARKPMSEKTVAANVLKWGTGGINIDGCRVEGEKPLRETTEGKEGLFGMGSRKAVGTTTQGRFPANLIHDGSQLVLELFPENGDKSPARFFYCPKASKKDRDEGLEGFEEKQTTGGGGTNDPNGDDVCGKYGSVKALSKNHHPTVKPTALMAYFCRLITPPGGTILDPYMGSGSTGKAAIKEGFGFIGIDKDKDYYNIAKARIKS